MLLVLLIVLVLALMASRKEMFGYAGYEGHVKSVVIDDPLFDTKDYVESTDVSVNNDLMEKIVLATNAYVAKKTGLCTYVIETNTVKKYVPAKKSGRDLYRCMFMLMRQHGFVFGFAVTVDCFVNPDGSVSVVGAHTQPIGVEPPADQTAFTSDLEGHAFPEFSLFEKSEANLIKISHGQY